MQYHITLWRQIPPYYLHFLNWSFELYIEWDKTSQWTKILPDVKSAHHYEVSFYAYRNSLVLKAIAGINWYNLTQLYMEDNMINNIEAMAWVDMPNLQLLYLAYNYITNFAPLSKTHLIELKGMRLQFNKSSNFTFLQKARFTPEFGSLILVKTENDEFEQYESNQPVGKSLNSLNGQFLAKIGIKKIYRLVIECPEFLRSQALKDKLRHAFGKMVQGEHQEFQAM